MFMSDCNNHTDKQKNRHLKDNDVPRGGYYRFLIFKFGIKPISTEKNSGTTEVFEYCQTEGNHFVFTSC